MESLSAHRTLRGLSDLLRINQKNKFNINNGLSTIVYIETDIYANANAVLAVNLAPKYNGKRNGWFGAREIQYDPQAKMSVYLVYDFDYYAHNLI